MSLPRIVKSARIEILLEKHRLHLGLYSRVAQCLGIDASYVSRVAAGQRKSDEVMRLLSDELLTLA